MQADSDGSDETKKKSRKKRKEYVLISLRVLYFYNNLFQNTTFNSSADWNDTDDSENEEKKNRKVRTVARISKSSKQRNKRITVLSSSDESESEESDNRTRTKSRRQLKQISYREQSDHTDSDDLIEVDYGDYNPETDVGETVEKVLELRMGKKGATGPPTAFYRVEIDGDPNGNFPEKEQQFLIKWKGFSHLHNTWETEESLASVNAKGIKKIENFLRKEDEIKQW